jgi:putative transposase
VKYAAIADWAADTQYPVTFMCAQLEVSRSGYYRWLAQGPCQRERTDAELTEQIRQIHTELHGNPGVRRVWAELVVRGYRVARKRVWRLMRAADLRGRHPRAWKRTTVAGPRPVDAPDLLGQDFTAERPDTRWCGDITYVRTVSGWAYLATVIDLHSRKVIGYAVADHLRTSLIVEALAAALVTRRPAAGVIFHSDRGCQPGLNRSSQHLDREVCYGTRARLGCGNDGQAAHAVTGSSAGRSQGTSKIVLEGNLPRSDKHGCGAHGRRVGGRRHSVVPRMWRSEALGGFPCGFGPVPVARRA